MREPLRLLLAGLVVVLVASACAGGDSGDEGSHGGAADLPGALPSDIAFEEAPANAVPAPELTAELVDGTPVDASDLWDDRPVVLVFTASWCDRCADVHRETADVVDEHEGVGLLGVVPADDAEGAREYADELQLGHPLAVAGDDVWLSYAVREPPAVVLVGRGGKVLRGWPGGVDPPLLAAHLEDLVRNPGSQGP
ncbi:MAG: TlpA family protein disulfide reductase [Gaiellaceae bacterium]